MIDILQDWEPDFKFTDYEPVVIDDIKVDDTTAEAYTLKDLLPDTAVDYRLAKPIKDKTVIAFIRLIYEASKKTDNVRLTTKRFCFSLDAVCIKFNIPIAQVKKMIEDDINFTIIYYRDEENGDFEMGHWVDEAGYKDETGFISMVVNFAQSHRDLN